MPRIIIYREHTPVYSEAVSKLYDELYKFPPAESEGEDRVPLPVTEEHYTPDEIEKIRKWGDKAREALEKIFSAVVWDADTETGFVPEGLIKIFPNDELLKAMKLAMQGADEGVDRD